MDWLTDVVARFRRELPLTIAIWTIVTIVLTFVFVNVQHDRPPEGFVGGMVMLAIALGPLAWMRWEHPLVRTRYHRYRRTLAVWILGCVWAVLALIASVIVLAIFGLD
jgi:uncharacterized membrane protein YidH (DUF202 family)